VMDSGSGTTGTQECVPLLHTYVLKLRTLLEPSHPHFPLSLRTNPPMTRDRTVGLDEDERRREIQIIQTNGKAPKSECTHMYICMRNCKRSAREFRMDLVMLEYSTLCTNSQSSSCAPLLSHDTPTSILQCDAWHFGQPPQD
jgi:hypothetical protein